MNGTISKCLNISNLALLLYLIFKSYINTVADTASNKEYLGANGVDNIQGTHFHDRDLPSTSTVYEFGYSEYDESDLTTNKILWSDLSESFVPKGLTFVESMTLVKNIRGYVVKTLRRGSWELCGDSKNGIADLADGSAMCVRYEERPYMLYAEVLSFYLSRMLQMDNTPEVTLAKTNSSSTLWREVNISTLGWSGNETVALIRRIPDSCYCTYLPHVIKEAYQKGKTVTSKVIGSSGFRNPADIASVIQLGTMMLFDNLIGQFDRLYFWKRFNQGNVTGKLHNSMKSLGGKIWLFDHEKSLFYLLKSHQLTFNLNSFWQFHEKWLKTMCVFQSSLVNELQKLSTKPSPFKTLLNYTLSYEPLLDTLHIKDQLEVIGVLFEKRLTRIMQWIQHCREPST